MSYQTISNIQSDNNPTLDTKQSQYKSRIQFQMQGEHGREVIQHVYQEKDEGASIVARFDRVDQQYQKLFFKRRQERFNSSVKKLNLKKSLIQSATPSYKKSRKAEKDQMKLTLFEFPNDGVQESNDKKFMNTMPHTTKNIEIVSVDTQPISEQVSARGLFYSTSHPMAQTRQSAPFETINQTPKTPFSQYQTHMINNQKNLQNESVKDVFMSKIHKQHQSPSDPSMISAVTSSYKGTNKNFEPGDASIESPKLTKELAPFFTHGRHQGKARVFSTINQESSCCNSRFQKFEIFQKLSKIKFENIQSGALPRSIRSPLSAASKGNQVDVRAPDRSHLMSQQFPRNLPSQNVPETSNDPNVLSIKQLLNTSPSAESSEHLEPTAPPTAQGPQTTTQSATYPEQFLFSDFREKQQAKRVNVLIKNMEQIKRKAKKSLVPTQRSMMPLQQSHISMNRIMIRDESVQKQNSVIQMRLQSSLSPKAQSSVFNKFDSIFTQKTTKNNDFRNTGFSPRRSGVPKTFINKVNNHQKSQLLSRRSHKRHDFHESRTIFSLNSKSNHSKSPNQDQPQKRQMAQKPFDPVEFFNWLNDQFVRDKQDAKVQAQAEIMEQINAIRFKEIRDKQAREELHAREDFQNMIRENLDRIDGSIERRLEYQKTQSTEKQRKIKEFERYLVTRDNVATLKQNYEKKKTMYKEFDLQKCKDKVAQSVMSQNKMDQISNRKEIFEKINNNWEVKVYEKGEKNEGICQKLQAHSKSLKSLALRDKDGDVSRIFYEMEEKYPEQQEALKYINQIFSLMDQQNEKDCLKADTIDIIQNKTNQMADQQAPTKLQILRGLGQFLGIQNSGSSRYNTSDYSRTPSSQIKTQRRAIPRKLKLTVLKQIFIDDIISTSTIEQINLKVTHQMGISPWEQIVADFANICQFSQLCSTLIFKSGTLYDFLEYVGRNVFWALGVEEPEIIKKASQPDLSHLFQKECQKGLFYDRAKGKVESPDKKQLKSECVAEYIQKHTQSKEVPVPHFAQLQNGNLHLLNQSISLCQAQALRTYIRKMELPIVHLLIDDCQMKDECFAEILHGIYESEIYSLEGITYQNNWFGRESANALMEIIRHYKFNIHTLSLSNLKHQKPYVIKKLLVELSSTFNDKWKSLKRVSLSNVDINHPEIISNICQFIENSHQMEHLDLSYGDISPQLLENLIVSLTKNADKLKSLTLCSDAPQDLPLFQYLQAPFLALTHLSINPKNVMDYIKNLAESTKLQVVHLFTPNLTEYELAVIRDTFGIVDAQEKQTDIDHDKLWHKLHEYVKSTVNRSIDYQSIHKNGRKFVDGIVYQEHIIKTMQRRYHKSKCKQEKTGGALRLGQRFEGRELIFSRILNLPEMVFGYPGLPFDIHSNQRWQETQECYMCNRHLPVNILFHPTELEFNVQNGFKMVDDANIMEQVQKIIPDKTRRPCLLNCPSTQYYPMIPAPIWTLLSICHLKEFLEKQADTLDVKRGINSMLNLQELMADKDPSVMQNVLRMPRRLEGWDKAFEDKLFKNNICESMVVGLTHKQVPDVERMYEMVCYSEILAPGEHQCLIYIPESKTLWYKDFTVGFNAKPIISPSQPSNNQQKFNIKHNLNQRFASQQPEMMKYFNNVLYPLPTSTTPSLHKELPDALQNHNIYLQLETSWPKILPIYKHIASQSAAYPRIDPETLNNFIGCEPETGLKQIIDIRGFLVYIIKQGRSAAGIESVVDLLEKLRNKQQDAKTTNFGPQREVLKDNQIVITEVEKALIHDNLQWLDLVYQTVMSLSEDQELILKDKNQLYFTTESAFQLFWPLVQSASLSINYQEKAAVESSQDQENEKEPVPVVTLEQHFRKVLMTWLCQAQSIPALSFTFVQFLHLMVLASTYYNIEKEMPGQKRLYQFLTQIWQSNPEFQKIELVKVDGLNEDERLAWCIDSAVNGADDDDILNEIGLMYKK